MKNHSIAFEVCHFFIAWMLRKITRLSEWFKRFKESSIRSRVQFLSLTPSPKRET
jgi:hypothetical protein